jgi:hypothetical protein
MAHRNKFEQQETERLHIEDFLRRKGINGSVEYGDMPDAVLLVEGHRVGLEHCELTEQDLAANRPNINALKRALGNELEKLGLGQDFSVGIGLNAAAPLFRKLSQVNELAGRMARFTFEQASALSVGATVALDAPALARHGFADLLCVTITRRRQEDPRGIPDTFVSPFFWGPGESSARAAVQAKERRLADYKAAKVLDEVWLLLVTGESWVQATDSVMTEWLQLSSTFDAVYLMDTRTGQLQRLDECTDE